MFTQCKTLTWHIVVTAWRAHFSTLPTKKGWELLSSSIFEQ